MATWGRPVTGHGRSERVTRHSETARLPHVRPGGRHLESLNPPAFHRRITLLKPRHFAPPSQALTPSPRKPCPGAPQTCSTPDSHELNRVAVVGFDRAPWRLARGSGKLDSVIPQ